MKIIISRITLCMGLLLYCLTQYDSLCAAEDDDFMVIRLDEFTESSIKDASELTDGISSGNVATDDSIEVQVYPLGKPLQVKKSYLAGNYANIDPISRSISGITNRYVPEFYGGMRNSTSAAEKVKRLYAGFYRAINNEWSWGVHLAAGFFDLLETEQQAADASNMFALDIASVYKPGTEWRLYNALVLGGTHDVLSVGARSRVEYNNRAGIGAIISGELWVPWAENTIAAKENGRTSGLAAEITLPFSQRVNLTLNTGVNWRHATDGMYSSSQFIGTELLAGGRVNWNFFQREYRQLPVEFLGRQYFNYETATSYVGLFASLSASTYRDGDAKTDEDYLIPVTKEQLDQRIGLSASYAFTSHLAATGEIYIGYDPLRDIDFGKLYGFDSRLMYIPTARMRVYGEFSLDSEAATGLEEGKTWYYGAGMNYKF